MLAAANVELVLYEGCLRMGSADVHLIIWPPGFSLASEDDGVQILNETGLIVSGWGSPPNPSTTSMTIFEWVGV